MQTCRYPPARIVDVRMVEPKVRTSTLGPSQGGEGQNATEQCEVAYGECTLKVFAPYLVGLARLGVDPHGWYVFTRIADLMQNSIYVE